MCSKIILKYMYNFLRGKLSNLTSKYAYKSGQIGKYGLGWSNWKIGQRNQDQVGFIP